LLSIFQKSKCTLLSLASLCFLADSSEASSWRDNLRSTVGDLVNEGHCQLDYLFGDYPWAMISIRLDQKVFCSPRDFRAYIQGNDQVLDKIAYNPDPKKRKKAYLESFKKLLPEIPKTAAALDKKESQAFSKDLLELVVNYELSKFREIEITYVLDGKLQRRAVKKEATR